GTKSYPASFRMPGRRHQCERLWACIQHHHAGGDRAAWRLGVDKHQFVRCDTNEAWIEALLRRLEFGHILLPGRNNLLWRHSAIAQTNPIRFQPELAETLQRPEQPTTLDVQGQRPGMFSRYFEALDRLSPAIRRALLH